ncbi:cytochrome c biogenesis protein CcsA [Paenibacillus urinalis]|uniref:Cytochrome c biogenesis protein CcsA n=1 Tax=Paenibacillus urinalis TaxID=521520 RepID=A0AAX3MV97_9BACL|nr:MULTISPECIES: cytochrome c biogenesis protein CcsA [Paenibacillus]WDH81267.1 cytochrome c biogenesis protein CcsA [Paenibacillus urinalis]WDH97318.1 cytochrome c biogenesis protein CcsA [Paenibacillus urinalis]WDI00981.1 cytochrome c biogenesis protein CcsA [Paenibacillus urinalis]GAK39973.1 cytochrome c-type biogenesis protein CcsB [Paenibacillus sp. TCA20]
MNNLLDLSSNAFLISFFLYCAAFIVYAIAIMGRKFSNRDPIVHVKKWGKIGLITTSIALVAQLIYFFTRWVGAGHIPVSNMYEFMSFLSMMVIIAFIVLFAIYKTPLLGLFALPITIILMAYAAVFPQEVQPLVPSLQSIWLNIHVTLAALGESFFAVGFAAGLMYLLRTVKFDSSAKSDKKQQGWVEFTLIVIIIVIGFIGTVFAFRASGYEAVFTQQEVADVDTGGTDNSTIEKVIYHMPPIVAPYNSETESYTSFLGMKEPLFEAPSWMNGVNAGRKLNTVIWSVVSGLVLYGLLRLIVRKPLGRAISPHLKDIDPDDLDEISYRAIAIGFPIFTLGALIFAMIWAEIAWGRFWGWDPKEVWALITWLYYSAYLHLRLSKGWQGRNSAWLAVIGFLIVMFTLVGVNLIISGLHSYAGTE